MELLLTWAGGVVGPVGGVCALGHRERKREVRVSRESTESYREEAEEEKKIEERERGDSGRGESVTEKKEKSGPHSGSPIKN